MRYTQPRRQLTVAAEGFEQPHPIDNKRTVTELVREREEARRRHDWATADRLRAKLTAAYGAVVDDSGEPYEAGDENLQLRNVLRSPFELDGEHTILFVGDSAQSVRAPNPRSSVMQRNWDEEDHRWKT